MTAQRGLRLDDIEIRLGDRTILALDAAVAPGGVLTVMGPSGSGKSTLLSFIGGFLDPAFSASGRVRLDGQDLGSVPAERRRIGLLFQDALLFPHMSVGQNLLFAVPPLLRRRAERRDAAEAMLARVELAGFFDRDPATLSGGQQARVALARTLIADPKALLLDEPFSRLDAALRESMRRLVFGLAMERAIPAILVTHDAADAAAAAGPVIRIGEAP